MTAANLTSISPDALSNLLLLLQTNSTFEPKDREQVSALIRPRSPGQDGPCARTGPAHSAPTTLYSPQRLSPHPRRRELPTLEVVG